MRIARWRRQQHLKIIREEYSMNYRHIYHAGNFADVFKHVALITLLKGMYRKEKPLCYFETHAGAGIFDLYSEASKKTREAQSGIIKLMCKADENNIVPVGMQSYLEITRRAGYPHYYPGSPLIAQSMFREEDEAILMELHPEDYLSLKKLFAKDKKTFVHHQDGYLGLKAFLPPKLKRGLILIDPPFEEKEEWDHLIAMLKLALKRFLSGVYAIWYPIKDVRATKLFLDKIKTIHTGEILNIEFLLFPKDANLGLVGCGMVILNPPWKFKEEMQPLATFLLSILAEKNQGSYHAEWLNGSN
jgi:23S rRNA (adenine2030-N6)-methyltransferase